MGSQYAEWSQYTTYGVDDVVQYAGQIYVATAVNLNVVPYPPNATWNNISPVNPGILAGYVKNPMDAPLQCYNPSTTIHYSIDDAAYVSASEVRTDQISLVPGSLENAIKIEDNIEMRTGTEIRAEHDLVFRTTGAWDYKMFNVRSGSQPVMLAYDPATGIVNQQPYIPGTGGTLVGVGAGTAITVDNTNPVFPVVNNDGVLTVNSEKGALTVAAGSGIGVATVGTTITISNTSPSSGGTLTGVGAGTNIAVDNTNPAVPVVSVSVSSNLDLNTKDIIDGGGATFAGTVQAGYVSSTNSVQGASIIANTGGVQATAGGMTAVAGNIIAQTGNIQATVGDITASAGNIQATAGTISGNTITAIAGGLKSYNGLDLNPTTINPTDITGAKDITATGDIGTGSGNIGTLTGDIAAPAGNVSGMSLTASTGGIACNGILNLNPTGLLANNIEGVDSFSSAGIVKGLNLLAYDEGQAYGTSSITLKTDDPLFASQNGTVASITYPDATAQNTVLYVRGAMSLSDPPNGGLPAQIIVNGVPQTLNGSDWSSYAATANVDMAGFDIDNAGAIGTTSLSASDFITSSTTITGLDVVASNSLTVNGLSVKPTLDFKPSATLYVAKNGNDTTGNGSMLQPYATIQKAYNTAILTSNSGNIFQINVATGHYTENLNLTGRGYVRFVAGASANPLGETTEITGTVNVALTGATDLYNRCITFSGFQITGQMTVSSATNHSVVLDNCKIYAVNRAFWVNSLGGATDMRIYLNNCAIQHQSATVNTDPLVECGVGWLYADKGSWTALNNSSVLSISGTGSALAVQGITMESDNADASLAPIVSITTTGTPVNTFGQCAMVAISSTAKASTPAVRINSASPPVVILLQNFFSIGGTSPATNVINYGGTAPTIQIGGCASAYSTAAAIQTGITAVPTTPVGVNGASSFVSVATGSLTSTGAISGTSITGTSLSSSGGTITGGAITGTSVSAGSGTISTSGAINGGAITGTSLAAGSGAITGATLTTTGAIKSSGTLQISGDVISNASNTTSITGLNSITMAGTAPSISGVNSLAITNTTAALPLDILNSGDNPQVRIRNAATSTTIPVEFNWVNGIYTLAVGQQATDPRGAFIFFNGKDVLRTTTTTPRLQMTYSPYTPTLALSGAAGAWVAGTGAFVSGVPKLLGTQTITLSAANFPIIQGGFGTEAYVGLNGYINTAVLTAASHKINITASYTRTRSGVLTPAVGQYALYGAAYPLTTNSDGTFYSPINGVSYNEAVAGERITFTLGDVLTLYIYGTYTGGSPPSITTPASGLAAVLSPFFL